MAQSKSFLWTSCPHRDLGIPVVNILLEIAGLVRRCAYQRGLIRGRDPGYIRVDFSFEFGIGKELEQLGAADFSLPLAQRAFQAVAMISHDFMYLDRTLGVPGQGSGRQPIAD